MLIPPVPANLSQRINVSAFSFYSWMDIDKIISHVVKLGQLTEDGGAHAFFYGSLIKWFKFDKL